MIYNFRFEHSKRLFAPEARAYYWNELTGGRLRQGWGRLGMSLTDETGNPLSDREWMRRYISASKRDEWRAPTKKGALGRYRLLSRMLDIQAGDLLVVLNLTESGRDGLVLVKAARQRPLRSTAKCYGWDNSAGSRADPLEGDHRHFVSVDPASIKVVRYDAGSAEGRLARSIRTDLGGLHFCIFPLTGRKYAHLIHKIESLYGGRISTVPKKERQLPRGLGTGHPPTREQIARGQAAEDEILKRLQRRELHSLRLARDCRASACGYDFLCRDAEGEEIEVEVKGFCAGGQLFLTEGELRQAKRSKERYWLVGLLCNNGSPRQWQSYLLVNPAKQIKRLGSPWVVTSWRVDPSQLGWELLSRPVGRPKQRGQ